MRRNVLNYPSPQVAFDRAQIGDEIYFPAEMEYQAPVGGWRIVRSLTIRGDGPGNPDSPRGTVLKPAVGSTSGVLVIDPVPLSASIDNIRIHDLCISGAGVAGGGLHGIHWNAQTGLKLSNLHIQRVSIRGMGGAGILLNGLTSPLTSDIVGALIEQCDIESCGQEGILLDQAFQVLVRNTRLKGNEREGIKATRSQLAAYVCTLVGNALSGGVANLSLETCTIARVDACRFLDFGSTLPALLITNCPGVVNVGACVFRLSSFESGAKGIKLVDGPLSPTGAMLILPNRLIGVGTGIEVESDTIANVVYPQYYDALGGSGGTPIAIPGAGADDALFAVPSAYVGTANKLSGLLVPAFGSSNPSSNVQGGMLAQVDGEVRVRIATDPAGDFRALKRTDAPATITDLEFGSLAGKTSLTVTWTAPHEPSWTGPVAEYDLRYAPFQLDDTNFTSGTRLQPSPTPLAPGAPQCARLTGLLPCTTYYAAIRSKDHSGQWSVAGSTQTSKKTRCSGVLEVECNGV